METCHIYKDMGPIYKGNYIIYVLYKANYPIYLMSQVFDHKILYKDTNIFHPHMGCFGYICLCHFHFIPFFVFTFRPHLSKIWRFLNKWTQNHTIRSFF